MPLATEQERSKFLEAIFAGSVYESWGNSWIEYFRAHGLPCVLPYRLNRVSGRFQPGFYIWCLAPDMASFRRIADECRAFLGKKYTLQRDLNTYRVLTNHGIGYAVHGRIYIPQAEFGEAQQAALQNWLAVWKARDQEYKPSLKQGDTAAQLRELRRTFEQCLVTDDRSGAQGALRSLDEAGLLEQTNLLFLRMRLLAHFKEWNAIIEDANFADLLMVRRTDPVTEALLQAVYHTHLSAYESNFVALFDHFRAAYSDYRPLFGERGGLRSPEALRLFLLAAVTLPNAQPDAPSDEVQSILAEPTLSDEERKFLQALADYAQSTSVNPTPPVSLLETSVATDQPDTTRNTNLTPSNQKGVAQKKIPTEGEGAFRDKFGDHSVALLRNVAPSTRKVVGLLSHSQNTGSLTARTLALRTLCQLSPAEQSVVLQTPALRAEVSRLVSGVVGPRPIGKTAPPQPAPPQSSASPKGKSVKSTAAVATALSPEGTPPISEALPVPTVPTTIPDDWAQWLAAVLSGEYGAEVLYEVAESGATQWNVSRLMTSPVYARRFAEQMEQVRDHGTQQAKDVFFDALPFLVRAVTNEDNAFPRPEAASIYQSLRQTVSFDFQDKRYDRNTLVLFYDLLVASLITGGVNDYQSTLEEVESFWDKDAPILAHELLNLIDALQDYPTYNLSGRKSLATRIFSIVSGWQQSSRIDARDLSYAARLAAEYDLNAMLAAPSSESSDNQDNETVTLQEAVDWSRLRGKRVNVYTLMESAGERVRRLIQNKCSECQVGINAEKAGSETLKQFARTADVLVIVTGSAKHAATEFLEKHLRTGCALLRPDGRGSSSILTTLENYLRFTPM